MARFSNITCSQATADYATSVALANDAGNKRTAGQRHKSQIAAILQLGSFSLMLLSFWAAGPLVNVLWYTGLTITSAIFILAMIAVPLQFLGGWTIFKEQDAETIEVFLFTEAVAQNCSALRYAWGHFALWAMQIATVAFLFWLSLPLLGIAAIINTVSLMGSLYLVRSGLRKYIARLDRELAL